MDGLIGYWPLDGDGADHSGWGRDLDLYGDPGFATGLGGQALDLYGDANQYAMRPIDDLEYNFGDGPFTVQAWVNYNRVGFEQTLVEKFVGGAGAGWTLTSFAGGSPAHFFTDLGAVNLRSSSSIPMVAGIWHQLIARRQGNTFDLFLDGSLMATADKDGPLPVTADPLMVGRRNSRSYPVDGRLDEIAIWNRSLTNSEISSLFNGGKGQMVPEPNSMAMIAWGVGSVLALIRSRRRV
ncbi:MAG: LamG domain-containing protein [Pirellulales bacterium]